MRLNAPKSITFWIAVMLAAVGFIAYLLLPSLVPTMISFLLVVIGFILLALGNTLKGF
jgi:hypothetical protein